MKKQKKYAVVSTYKNGASKGTIEMTKKTDLSKQEARKFLATCVDGMEIKHKIVSFN